MKFNKKAVQRELDKSASEMDQHGYVDLADKVDHFNKRLMEAKTKKEVQEIYRHLARIYREAKRREEPETKPARKPALRKTKTDRRKEVLKARRLSERKKAFLKRRKAQQNKKEKITPRAKAVDNLFEARKRRLAKEKHLEDLRSELYERRAERVRSERENKED